MVKRRSQWQFPMTALWGLTITILVNLLSVMSETTVCWKPCFSPWCFVLKSNYFCREICQKSLAHGFHAMEWIFMGPNAELNGVVCNQLRVRASACFMTWSVSCLVALCFQYLRPGLHLFRTAFPLGWCSGVGSLAPLHLSLGAVLGTFHSWLTAGRFGRGLWSE